MRFLALRRSSRQIDARLQVPDLALLSLERLDVELHARFDLLLLLLRELSSAYLDCFLCLLDAAFQHLELLHACLQLRLEFGELLLGARQSAFHDDLQLNTATRKGCNNVDSDEYRVDNQWLQHACCTCISMCVCVCSRLTLPSADDADADADAAGAALLGNFFGDEPPTEDARLRRSGDAMSVAEAARSVDDARGFGTGTTALTLAA